MTTLPASAVVLGSGAGALSSAMELSERGVDVTVADFERFRANVDAIIETGVIRLKSPWHQVTEAPARGSLDPAAAVRDAPLVVVSVPAFGHDTFAELLAHNLSDGQLVVFAGEGGGSLALVAAMRRAGVRPRVEIAELNSLPYGARVRKPGLITASRKVGGTLVAGLPAGNRAQDVACELWQSVSKAESVWETVLLNFNAIDHVPPILGNLGTIDGGPGKFLLWGQGASPAVCLVIAAVDAELVEIRRALGFTNLKGYEEYLVEQGFAPEYLGDLYRTLQSSAFADSTFATGPRALESRYITEDVPYALNLMASIGREVGTPTPTIDALIHLAGVATGTDYAREGRTLAAFGLEGAGRDGLLAASTTGWW
ncbi:NAD/NADP octopine/nopaline dehydrogenase family protein [Georgenia sp. H159]|uniref:NAD/NADP octopine/nopaline dehydrogenase family protein n=1 Tax=Georgenia sp. H159 TaxID=3076115 RepID=UPI002D7916B3|nr:NAD/NADP octopine/nopaline dehydrogenase family protein [Georgenia sp. H159]